ncbi:MAG: helix-turn-helix domain-containing protein, partial [Nitriliruptoraceae bacterium]
MPRGTTARGPAHRPAGAWVVASRPDALAQLLEAVDRAGMLARVVATSCLGSASDDHPPPEVVLIQADAAAAAPATTLECFRRAAPNTPILVITDERPIRWLTCGATVALPAQTSTPIIALQLNNLRALRPEQPWSPRVQYGPFEHDPARASLRVAGVQVRCSAPLSALLLRLLQAEGGVVHAQELRQVLQRARSSEATDLRAHVRRLRACLDLAVPGLGEAVETVRGTGYRLDLERAA